MPVQIKRIGADRSKDRAIGIIHSLFSQYEWQSDMETHGREEWWMGYLEQLKTENIIRDDCDGFSRLVIDLLFFIGGFQLYELAECVVDVNQNDGAIFDHHVGAVLIKNKWLYFHCWSPRLLTQKQLEKGLYKLPSGQWAAKLKIVEHRKATAPAHEPWILGEVK